MQLDHIAVSGETLEAATYHVEECLGVRLQSGGAHDVFFTHNMLLGLEDGLYLEAIAINPTAPVPDRPRWFGLDHFSGNPRLTNWICRCTELEATLPRLPQGSGLPVRLQRGALRWRMAVPASGMLPFDNCAPALIQWQTLTHPATSLVASGVRMRRLTISHPQADLLSRTVAGLMSDDRIAYETGRPGLSAEFDTPGGGRAMLF